MKLQSAALFCTGSACSQSVCCRTAGVWWHQLHGVEEVHQLTGNLCQHGSGQGLWRSLARRRNTSVVRTRCGFHVTLCDGSSVESLEQRKRKEKGEVKDEIRKTPPFDFYFLAVVRVSTHTPWKPSTLTGTCVHTAGTRTQTHLQMESFWFHPLTPRSTSSSVWTQRGQGWVVGGAGGKQECGHHFMGR